MNTPTGSSFMSVWNLDGGSGLLQKGNIKSPRCPGGVLASWNKVHPVGILYVVGFSSLSYTCTTDTNMKKITH